MNILIILTSFVIKESLTKLFKELYDKPTIQIKTKIENIKDLEKIDFNFV